MTDTPYQNLTPELVLDAVESLGMLSDARIYPLNSYENRVYQVGIEDSEPVIVKFYRPGRWQSEQIIEEHEFSLALEALDVPVVPPESFNEKTLLEYKDFRFAIFKRRGGHAPELDNDDNLFILGQHIGRIHALGKTKTFQHRPSLNIKTFGYESRSYLMENTFLPDSLRAAYETTTADILKIVEQQFKQCEYQEIRLHGDCHPGNILWRNDRPNFVDLDDSRNGPAIQDLWMLLSGDYTRRQQQLMAVVEGYEEFCEFNPAEIPLIESLRALRIIHYAAWLARRWSDPAFPKHFPWFNTERYWAEHILELREQFSALQEPHLKLTPY